jgi:murein DD-endopeptidase MepM/ murein hydrolase activator NlpD
MCRRGNGTLHLYISQSTTPDPLWRPSRRAVVVAVLVVVVPLLLLVGGSRGAAPRHEAAAVAGVSTAKFVEIASDAAAMPTPLPGRAARADRSRSTKRRGAGADASARRAPVAAPVAEGVLAVPVGGEVPQCGWFHCPRPGHLHNGLDISAVQGTPVLAAADGVVTSVEMPEDSEGYGLFVCLQHGPRLATCYAHMSAWVVGIEPGARVARGQPIGLVGSTGHSTGPHLHFEVREGPASCHSCAVDPYPYFLPPGSAAART